jgi:hypothetical protein
MSKLCKFLPADVMRSLYNSFVLPYLVYGVEFWFGCSKTQLALLRRIQNKCVRFTTDYDVSILELYRINSLFKFDDLYKFYVLLKLFKYVELGQSIHFASGELSTHISHDHTTRFSLGRNYVQSNINLSVYFKSFLYQSINHWNNLPIEIKNCKSFHQFKIHLRKFILG